MTTIVAIVKSLVGQVFAVSLDGLKRQIFEGERLLMGEQILTGLGGEVTLQLANGELVNVAQNSNWQSSASDTQTEGNKVEPNPNLEQALTAGFDPTVDLEATAAGPGVGGGTGGAAGGGHSFVLLGETGQRLDPTVGFETEGLGFAGQAIDEEAGAEADVAITANSSLENNSPSAVNDGPVAVTEDTAATGNVLTNDTDPENDTLSVTQFTVAGDATVYTAGSTATIAGVGTLLINSNGSFTFTPASNYNGPVPTATYTVTDGDLTDTAELSFADVAPVNDAPLAVNDGPVAVTEDTAATGNVLTNDTDPENDTLSVTQFTVAGDATVYTAGSTATIAGVGTLLINSNGSFTFTPASNYNGPVPTATYTVTDGDLTDTAELSFADVAPVNDAPLAVNDGPVAVTEDTAATGNVLTNDTDPENDTLSVTQFTVAGDATVYTAGSTATIAGVGTC
ncbi:retention module-containing protein, partial [Pseudomonas peli]|uniref:retention module-containing protein n=1 Tax=Pseudomonas peli TaxID=592361 RepID=UPI003D30F07E